MCESYLEMTHSYVWHDTFVCVTWLIHMRDMTHWYVWHDSLICVTWLIRMRDVTHSYARHDSFLRVPWLIHVCNTGTTKEERDSFAHGLEKVRFQVYIYKCNCNCNCNTSATPLQHLQLTWKLCVREHVCMSEPVYGQTKFVDCFRLVQIETHCSALQYTATHCNTL